MKKKWFRPYLEFWLDVWLISVKSDLFHEAWAQDRYEYIVVSVRVLGGRRGFSFRLYRPGYSRKEVQ